MRKTGNEIIATVDLQNNYYEQSLFSFGLSSNDFNINYIVAILNSKLSKYLLKDNAFSKKETFPQIRLHWLKDFPIKQISILQQKSFIENVDIIISLNKTLQQQQFKVVNMLQRDYGLTKPTKKLETWYELPMQSFFAELEKAKIVLSAVQKDEVQEYFESYQKQAIATKSKIVATDKAIDKMVYELYGLSEEEISIVEKS